MTAAFVFPGQGSQTVGMGKGLAEAFAPARLVFEEVDAALGEQLSEIIWNGPAETLTLTENAQPALMAVSLAAMRVLEAEAGVDLARDAAFVAGHSLGEYSALAAARSLSIADAARLLRIRGLAMQKAVPVGEPAEIVRCLIAQVTGTVRWRESIHFMAQSGVTSFYEVGAGKVLTGLIKRIAETATASAIGVPDDIARFKAARG
jgi:malonyl CoA-acyl carrier protein transacylase